jgi:uncharacterized protein (TIGR02246 family)
MDAPDADLAAIARTTAALLEAVNASDADRCVSLWADDGVLMPPHHPSVHGRQAIRDYFRNLFSRSRFTFMLVSSEIQVAGNTAVERLTYTASIWTATGSSPVEDFGKGLHVYRREPDGSWKLTQDIWNSNQPD